MFVLWKDHTAVKEASEINELAKRWKIDYTAYSEVLILPNGCGLRCYTYFVLIRQYGSLLIVGSSIVIGCQLCCQGNILPEKIYRSRCAAGHKAMWCRKWGLPLTSFLPVALDPLLNLFNGHLSFHLYE